MRSARNDGPLCCSFCMKSHGTVGKLISSPNDHPRAYICNECIAVCNDIIEDDRVSSEEPDLAIGNEEHPLLAHPFASQLMEAVELWVREESLHKDAFEQLMEVRRIARQMVR